MHKPHYPNSSATVYYRLIALWILCEAVLGGIIHGFRIPISGLVVGSAAVICITQIAWFNPVKGAILKATIIVAIFKMMLSPQAPITAYLAVFFQGLLGEMLFWHRRLFKIACLAFASIALVESGVQRILIVTIVYGNDVWTATNELLERLFPKTTGTNYSYILGTIYIAAHLLAGILVGLIAGVIPEKYKRWPWAVREDKIIQAADSKRKRNRNASLIIIWIALLLLLLQSEYGPGSPLLPSPVPIRIVIRSVIIVLAWLLIISPLLKKLLDYWLTKRKKELSTEISLINGLLPDIRTLALGSWKQSSHKKGRKRLILFAKMLAGGILNPNERSVVIITGKINGGKTTHLNQMISSLENVGGILSPKINRHRYFENISTRERFLMDADDIENHPVLIGRHRFSRSAFEKSKLIIRQAIDKNEWVVIDEIGPLELKQSGFHDEILLALKTDVNLILVVRDTLLNEVKTSYSLNTSKIIDVANNIEVAK